MHLLDIKSDFYGTRRNGYLGIFLQCARLNHSCRPNVARAVGDDNVTSVVAQRNIHEGEEITISYLDDISLIPPPAQVPYSLRSWLET